LKAFVSSHYKIDKVGYTGKWREEGGGEREREGGRREREGVREREGLRESEREREERREEFPALLCSEDPPLILSYRIVSLISDV
jgi:hypothetical protein